MTRMRNSFVASATLTALLVSGIVSSQTAACTRATSATAAQRTDRQSRARSGSGLVGRRRRCFPGAAFCRSARGRFALARAATSSEVVRSACRERLRKELSRSRGLPVPEHLPSRRYRHFSEASRDAVPPRRRLRRRIGRRHRRHAVREARHRAGDAVTIGSVAPDGLRILRSRRRARVGRSATTVSWIRSPHSSG